MKKILKGIFLSIFIIETIIVVKNLISSISNKQTLTALPTKYRVLAYVLFLMISYVILAILYYILKKIIIRK